MRVAVWILLFAVVLLVAFLTVDFSEQAMDHDTVQVKTVQQWGRVAAPYVVDSAMFPPPARARTAPNRRTVHALSVPASAGEAVAVIRDVFSRFGPEVVEQAVRVSGCETGGTYNPAIVNSSGHTGLFQLSPKYHTARASRLGFTWAQMREARPNALVAADLYAESGWDPWTCRTAA